jgi:hypothetical protein
MCANDDELSAPVEDKRLQQDRHTCTKSNQAA